MLKTFTFCKNKKITLVPVPFSMDALLDAFASFAGPLF